MYRLKSFFRGRYGFRGISIPIAVIAGLIILYTILFPLAPNGEMRILMAVVLLGVVVARALSRNIEKNKSVDMMFGYMLSNIKGRFKAWRSGRKPGGNRYSRDPYGGNPYGGGNPYESGGVKKEKAAKTKPAKTWADENYRLFKCPKCKQRLRVPKGKGKVLITCSKCGERFTRKT